MTEETNFSKDKQTRVGLVGRVKRVVGKRASAEVLAPDSANTLNAAGIQRLKEGVAPNSPLKLGGEVRSRQLPDQRNIAEYTSNGGSSVGRKDVLSGIVIAGSTVMGIIRQTPRLQSSERVADTIAIRTLPFGRFINGDRPSEGYSFSLQKSPYTSPERPDWAEQRTVIFGGKPLSLDEVSHKDTVVPLDAEETSTPYFSIAADYAEGHITVTDLDSQFGTVNFTADDVGPESYMNATALETAATLFSRLQADPTLWSEAARMDQGSHDPLGGDSYIAPLVRTGSTTPPAQNAPSFPLPPPFNLFPRPR